MVRIVKVRIVNDRANGNWVPIGAQCPDRYPRHQHPVAITSSTWADARDVRMPVQRRTQSIALSPGDLIRSRVT